MATAKTDDFESEAVQQCLATPDPDAVRAQPACSQNVYWKNEVCRVVRTGKKEADACARDRKFIPDIVAKVSRGLGEAMRGEEIDALDVKLADRGW